MDDLNLTGKTEDELQKQIQVVTTFSDYMHMELDLTSMQRLYSREEN